MAEATDWKKPVILRWVTKRPTPSKRSKSRQFNFQNQDRYLSLEVDAGYYRLFLETVAENERRLLGDVTVELKNRITGSLLPFMQVNRNLDLTKTCFIWGCLESCIGEAENEFLVLLDPANESRPKLKDDKFIKTPKYMDVSLQQLSADFSKLLDGGSKPDDEFLRDDMEINADTFKLFLRYVYKGTLPELTTELAMALYEAGDKYAVDSLVVRCGDFLAKNLTPENACGVLVFLDAHNDKNYQEDVIAFIMEKEVPLKDDLWSEFSDLHPKLADKVVTRFCNKMDCSE